MFIMKKRKCAYCGDEFESTRRTAKFCGDNHRSAFQYARRVGRPIPAIDDQPVKFRHSHRLALHILKRTSPAAVSGLEKIIAEYGVEAAEVVFREIIVPLNNGNFAIVKKIMDVADPLHGLRDPKRAIEQMGNVYFYSPLNEMRAEPDPDDFPDQYRW